MQANIDGDVHIKMDGEIADLLVRRDLTFKQYKTYKKGKPVIYAKLEKALYGTLQAAKLFWEDLSKFLTQELGFKTNPYNQCVANKIIEGLQCTIGWHVDR